MNAGVRTLEATKEELDSVTTMPTDIEKAVLSAPLINEKPKRRRKPTVFEESEPTTDGGNE